MTAQDTARPPAAPVKKTGVPAKSIALPVEHGAWGFLLEPLAAGLILAPSAAAPWIALFVTGAFLLRQPIKFLLADWLARRELPRTAAALRFALIYGALMGTGLLGSAVTAPAASFVPFAAFAPLVAYLIIRDAARKTRALVPELSAAAALAATAPTLALAAGWSLAAAFALWVILLGRLIPAILYVRSRLQLEKGGMPSRLPAVAAHLAALIAAAALYRSGFGSLPVLLMLSVLLGRAAWGLSGWRRASKARSIGIREVIFGAVYVLAVVLGHYVDI